VQKRAVLQHSAESHCSQACGNFQLAAHEMTTSRWLPAELTSIFNKANTSDVAGYVDITSGYSVLTLET